MKRIGLAVLAGTMAFSAAAEKTDLELVGSQAAHSFFVLSQPWITNMSYVEQVARNYCSTRSVCVVHFWERGTPAATRLPLTDAQAAAEMATYRSNKNTGSVDMLWRCGRYKEATRANCFSD